VDTGGIARLSRDGCGLFLAFEGDHGFFHRRKEKEVGGGGEMLFRMIA